MTELVITVQADENAVPRAPRPLKSSKAKWQLERDEQRRPQAAVLFRALRERTDGMAWRELWALGESNPSEWAWEVGPIVVWLRAQGVSVVAEYDTANGETRFYLPVL